MKILTFSLLIWTGVTCESYSSDKNLSLSPAPHKPNIVFIMADDLGYSDLSCYGSASIKTPHLDRLAAEGVKCVDFHSNGAVCSPTRAALMTGRYQQRSGVDGVITAKSHRDKGLAVTEWTIGDAMKELGYATALFGKWHLGYDSRYNPTKQGFDEFKGFVSGNIDYQRHIDQEGHFDWWIQAQKKDESGYLTDLINQHGIDFIRRHKGTPFCLILAHGAPHYPLQGRKTPGHRVEGKPYSKQPRLRLENPKAVYREMVEVMDEGIGDIVKELEALDLRKNTLIIFCSDNGPANPASAKPLRGKKGTVWEGGHRVCGIFNWPGKVPAGSECSATLMTMDLLPTMVEIGGGKIRASRQLDGRNILPAIVGESFNRGAVFWQHGGSLAVREGVYKLVMQRKKTSLYDLSKDLAEAHDIRSQHPELTHRLEKKLRQWQAEVKSAQKRQ